VSLNTSVRSFRADLIHTFVSQASTQCETIYLFPLPPDASVHAFEATIDDRTIRGVIRERQAARVEFEVAVSQGEQAALLQQDNIES
jgi:hypothetical protein